MTRPVILKAASLPETTVAELEQLFTVLHLPEEKATIPGFLADHGRNVRGLALRKTVVDRPLLDALPALEVIASYSAGLDNVDLQAVDARGIRIRNSSHVLEGEVANLAVALLLGVTRDLVGADAFVRDGSWAGGRTYPLGRSLIGMRTGIIGLGAIGSAIATRLQALGAVPSYTGPRRKPINLPYYSDILALARASDALIVACPLTEDTRHAVDAAVLQALGPCGYLINVSRGPVVDEAALVASLAEDWIAGAGLDVFDAEPQVPIALKNDPRVLLTPHIGSGTHQTRQAMADHVVDTLAAHFGLSSPTR